MADKLDWLNQHFVLLLHKTVAEVIANENYKLPFELRQNALTYPQSDAFIYELEKQNELKKASEFLAYNLQQDPVPLAQRTTGYFSSLSSTASG